MLQLRYVQSAAELIPTYKPDGLDDIALGTQIDDAKAVRPGSHRVKN
jgi:hypothetical protein